MFLQALLLALAVGQQVAAHVGDMPKFAEAIPNVTVTVGREATLTCVVDDLSSYKVAWLRVDTQTILTIHTHVITKNHRIGVTQSDHRSWYLQIKEVREADRGWYMCQINTDPMKSHVGYLEVVVPPDILDYPTSSDMVVREGSNVTLKCAASGSPQPIIQWRREDGGMIPVSQVPSVEGSLFNITRVNRLHMGAYLCIASNGVPPTVSKRIMLIVHFPPMISIPNQLVGAYEGQMLTLECQSEAYPKSINYWTRENGEIIAQGEKYEPTFVDNAYKVHMKLTIKSVAPEDFGSFKCVSKNSLGDTDGKIKIYPIPHPSTTNRSPVTTMEPVPEKERKQKGSHKKERIPVRETNEIVDESQPNLTRNRDNMKLRRQKEGNSMLPTDEEYSSAATSAIQSVVLISICIALALGH
ncbi:opioid-binding protein/cell adhesion molecule homolog isoform X2 [Neocloeon triangulifer]|uniref:opioid-binding protein/cell adhesion molecule homolog isoform X2 n=1 Tax=Neocloeon triangulifer TaxID=2078957 RepID=UPI00286EF7C9|nr:opioid-binding protein/cell adhesion molecule homolog isoform X2 [Neocloeon triangulifer]